MDRVCDQPWLLLSARRSHKRPPSSVAVRESGSATSDRRHAAPFRLLRTAFDASVSALENPLKASASSRTPASGFTCSLLLTARLSSR